MFTTKPNQADIHMGLIHVLRLQRCCGSTACLLGLFFLLFYRVCKQGNHDFEVLASHFFLQGHDENIFNFILYFLRAKSYNHRRWLGTSLYPGNFPFSPTIKTTWHNSSVVFLIANFAILKHRHNHTHTPHTQTHTDNAQPETQIHTHRRRGDLTLHSAYKRKFVICIFLNMAYFHNTMYYVLVLSNFLCYNL